MLVIDAFAHLRSHPHKLRPRDGCVKTEQHHEQLLVVFVSPHHLEIGDGRKPGMQ